MDCRGQGGLSQNVGIPCGSTFKGHILRGIRCEDPSYLLYRDIYLDAAQMVRIVMSMPEVDEKRVGAFGGSQGGGLTLACAALTPGLNRAAAQFPSCVISSAPGSAAVRTVQQVNSESTSGVSIPDINMRTTYSRDWEILTTSIWHTGFAQRCLC